MRIAICGSMTFAVEMVKVKASLEKLEHQCVLPHKLEERSREEIHGITYAREVVERKLLCDFIQAHFEEIKKSDAILILNYTRFGIDSYIGGDALMEIGFAYALQKKIFILNQVPNTIFSEQELLAVEAIVLNGDLNKIKTGA